VTFVDSPTKTAGGEGIAKSSLDGFEFVPLGFPFSNRRRHSSGHGRVIVSQSMMQRLSMGEMKNRIGWLMEK